MTAGADGSAFYGQRAMRVRKRPITGARQLGSVKNRAIAGNAGLMYYGGFSTNRQSSKDCRASNFKTMTQREKESRLFSGKKMLQ